ncbi:MAG: ATP-dependent helicase [Phycisphaerae bacterium]|nr:ATP-dependent helicase [Phycisphaerae bacterium]
MKLTDAQRAAVDEESRHVLVVACPGSGKTRTIVARLLRAIEHVRCTPRRVACITYTNAAAHEIEARLKKLISADDADYCDVGTIHSFCLQAVLRHHHRLLGGYQSGLAVAAPESPEFAEAAQQALADTMRGHGNTQEFERVRRDAAGEPLIPTDVGLTDECVRRFWELLAEWQFVDFPSITYLTFRLFELHSHLAKSVSSRYREILIDEMQDTDALQVQVLRRLADVRRSRFFLVGDHFQSIQGFAGAQPERMFELAAHLDARTDFPLHENWRSSSSIVALGEALCPRDPTMVAVGPDADYHSRPRIMTAASGVDAVVGGFIPLLAREGIAVTDAAVLAPAWYMLFPIARELRRLGVPVSGPGARPYRRARLFTGLIEYLCAYIDTPAPQLLHRVQVQLFHTVQQTEGLTRFDIWDRLGRLSVMRLVICGRELRSRNASAIAWLAAAAPAFTGILREHGLIKEAGATAIETSASEIIADIRRNRDFDADDLTVDDIGDFAHPDGSLRLLTLHSAKGREFEAVCIIELQDSQFPHPRGDIEESRRVLYVGITRPRKVLLLCHRRGITFTRYLSESRVVAALNE